MKQPKKFGSKNFARLKEASTILSSILSSILKDKEK